MAKRKDKSSARTSAPRIVNRRARHDYHISETLEVGVVLQGTEVKSVRAGQVSLAEGFARVEPSMELWLYNVDIATYQQASAAYQHQTKAARKLLAHKREIARLHGMTTGKGVTLVPLSMYFVRGRAKVELGVATGKQHYDKRQDLRKREADLAIRRAMSKRV